MIYLDENKNGTNFVVFKLPLNRENTFFVRLVFFLFIHKKICRLGAFYTLLWCVAVVVNRNKSEPKRLFLFTYHNEKKHLPGKRPTIRKGRILSAVETAPTQSKAKNHNRRNVNLFQS